MTQDEKIASQDEQLAAQMNMIQKLQTQLKELAAKVQPFFDIAPGRAGAKKAGQIRSAFFTINLQHHKLPRTKTALPLQATHHGT